MDDERRRDHERSRRDGGLLPVCAESDRQLARKDVEEVGVVPVDMGIGTVTPGPESRPRRAQLIAVAKDLDAALLGVSDHLAFAGG
jgi:hypothetical protein